MPLNRICVYCGSNPGRTDTYLKAARELGRAIAQQGVGLVYGGASVGVMGVVADAVLDAGGKVTGVIPEALVEKELAHNGLSELYVTDSMHERKRMMADLADAFVALPGGAGTLEEIFEVWTWAQLGHHRKPCALYNVDGYYDRLAQFLDHSVEEQFMKPAHRDMLIVTDRPDELLQRFAAYEPPLVGKWIGKEDT